MKKLSFLYPLLVMLAMLAPATAGAQFFRGDCDGNGNVNISDVTTLIDYLLSGDWSSPAGEPANGSVVTYDINGVPLKMVYVRGGTFTMGGTAEQGSDVHSSELPAHYVTLSGYYIAQTEVTQALWTAVMGSNPSNFTGDYQLPVERVSWNDCQTFVTRLQTLTGLNFRLPTEAEWEYAARGGSKSQRYQYSGSNTPEDVAWYRDNSRRKTHDVKTKRPNELGIYDMSGNVCEWCQDWYGSYNSSAQTNPKGPESGSYRVDRGGSYSNSEGNCRVTDRGCGTPTNPYVNLGFRLASQ